MFKPLKISCLCLCMISLTGCMLDGTSNNKYFWDTTPDADANQLYPDSYDTSTYPQTTNPGRGTKEVVIPQSYHLGLTNTPTPSKNEDRQWIDNQSPDGYTIQIANDNKPSQVANTLYKVPKNERTAEVKSQNGAYLGLYGSYATREAAESQLNALPEDLRQKAEIKHWQAIQNEIN